MLYYSKHSRSDYTPSFESCENQCELSAIYTTHNTVRSTMKRVNYELPTERLNQRLTATRVNCPAVRRVVVTAPV